MNRLFPLLLSFVFALLVATVPATAATTKLKNNLRVTGNLTVDGTSTVTGATTQSGNFAVTGNETVGGTLGVTGASTLTGNTTVGGTLGVTGAVTLTVPLTAANIQTGSAKRQLLTYHFASNVADGTAADSTVYRAVLFPGRAATVKNISFGCVVAPTVGTDSIKVLKGSSSGNTMLSAATFDANTLTANQATAATLTATGADLTVAATGANSGIYVEYSAGSQTVDAKDLSVTIEIEPTDF